MSERALLEGSPRLWEICQELKAMQTREPSSDVQDLKKSVFGSSSTQLEIEAVQRSNTPRIAEIILEKLMLDRITDPVLERGDKEVLARETGLTPRQITQWLSNKRKRVWKPLYKDGKELTGTFSLFQLCIYRAAPARNPAGGVRAMTGAKNEPPAVAQGGASELHIPDVDKGFASGNSCSLGDSDLSDLDMEPARDQPTASVEEAGSVMELFAEAVEGTL